MSSAASDDSIDDTSSDPSNTGSGGEKQTGWLGGCLTIIVLLGIFIAIGFAFSSCADTTPRPDRFNYKAEAACERAVVDKLISPATADIYSRAEGTESDWTIAGYVDSENVNGALIRSDFQCTVHITDDSQDVVVDFLRDRTRDSDEPSSVEPSSEDPSSDAPTEIPSTPKSSRTR